MYELAHHIEVLLLTNDCVVVPGLGGFVAHHVCARYNESEGLFLPPARTLGFNPQLTVNDSLLTQSYMETYDMSYPEALRRVESDVEELRQELSERGTYDIHGVGTLSISSDRTLTFEPCVAGLLTPSLYALNFLEFEKLTAGTSTQPDEQAQENTTGRKARIIYIDKESGSGQPMLNIRVSALRQAAVAAMIALVVALALNTDLTPTPHSESYKSGILSFLYSRENTTHDITTDAKPAIKPVEKKSEPKARQVSLPHWTVVLCSHVSNKNAESFRESLLKEGITATVIPGEKAGAKVVYGSYASKEEAHTALRGMRGSKHFEQGWIMLVEK